MSEAPLEAFVIGAGPGGITALGNLVDAKIGPVGWCDPKFQAGRVGDKYEEVPSNTKVALFVQFAEACECFKEIISATAEPNAMTSMKSLEQSRGCHLKVASDMIKMLTQGLCARIQLYLKGMAQSIEWIGDDNHSLWKVTMEDGTVVKTKRVVLCTGSYPIKSTYPLYNATEISLDTALKPTELQNIFQPNDIVGVIGSSHSAILALRNIFNLPPSSQPKKVYNFFRSPLRYAVYKPEGWILYDNTGLKGEVAEWAKENLADECEENQANNPNGKIDRLERICVLDPTNNNSNNNDIVEKYFPTCTKIIAAIGYATNPLPTITYQNQDISETMAFDNDTGFFHFSNQKPESERLVQWSGKRNDIPPVVPNKNKVVPGIYGCGIAFPERVVDPQGNVELAVGMWKFMKAVKGMVPRWIR